MSFFVPGQRWISNTESELGLGLVLDVSTSRVSLVFFATGDKRVYAIDNAPLTRVAFSVGDVIETSDSIKVTVESCVENEGLLLYQGLDENGHQFQVLETELNHHLQFNKPQERLFTGQYDPASWFLLRYQTWQRHQQQSQSEINGLQGGRAALIPHQLFIAHEVAVRVHPRVMLSDEVGLGKTIEAGMILNYRLLHGLSQRVLIIVPESLMHQWLVEMIRRFYLRFSLFDEERCQAIEEENPFFSEQLVLCSQEFFSRNPLRSKQALVAEWDLIVIDEAHHLVWSEKNPSAEYEFVEQLADKTPALILLSATPEQMGKESHFARLKLLDPDRFFSFQQYLQEVSQFEPVASLANSILQSEKLNVKDYQQLQSVLGESEFAALQSRLKGKSDHEDRKEEIIQLLMDHHGTGRVLFRNSRQTVKGFPVRHCHAYPLEQLSDRFPKIKDLALNWLCGMVDNLKTEQKKGLLICKTVETVLQLQEVLNQQFNMIIPAFHEGMRIVDRDRAAAYFADEECVSPLLISSEIGSEGRNFQFLHDLILFDLPDHPDLLQQRIGRLDRIGQQEAIQIHIPFIPKSYEHFLYRWYQDGFDIFSVNSSSAAEVVRQLNVDLKSFFSEADDQAIDKFVETTLKLKTRLEREMNQGRDQLLELNSCRIDKAKKLRSEISELDNDPDLWPYMELLLDSFGVEIEEHSADSYILRAGENMRLSNFPLLGDDGLTLTVDRQKALAREDMLFLTQEHPLFSATTDLVLSSETGNSAISIISHPELETGCFFLEIIFVLECSAPSKLQLGRFLPPTPIRIMIDQNGKNLTEFVSHDSLLEIDDKIEKQQLVQFFNSQKETVQQLIAQAEKVAEQTMQQYQANASKQMLEKMTTEIKRLVRLKQINPGIKDAEINQYKEKVLAMHQSINQAKLRLDAIRFLVTAG